ncbi:DUF4345 domain-containing protein [Ferrimonas pelagia]|uniref:DUF4345 domain-containing protein n=1 Tax=Ferrimonas pelagia TaxID=1177826 RepID=A0ABP9EU58_9GAMM
MAKLLIALVGGLFLLYGLAYILAPTSMMFWTTGDGLDTASARIDTRATYGGLFCAVGVALLGLSRDQNHQGFGLIFVATVLFGMAIGRSFGLLLDGTGNLLMWLFVGLELGGGALALWLLRRQRG